MGLSMFERRRYVVALLYLVGLVPLFESRAVVAAEALAAIGRPFGVAQITLPRAGFSRNVAVETNGYEINQAQNRVFYPVFAHRRVIGILRELVGADDPQAPDKVIVHFLFRGDAPFQVTLHLPQRHVVNVRPVQNPRLSRRLMRSWWRQYTSVARIQESEGDYPPLVQTYLTTMLGNRLGLRPPLLEPPSQRATTEQESLQLVLNVESMRMEQMRRSLQGGVDLGTANLPLPAPIDWASPTYAPIPEDVEVEPIAKQVPPECYYLRFSRFRDYLWLKRFLEDNGGSLQRMVSLRGQDAGLNEKAQQQLGLRDTKLAEMVGDQLISDVAIIGRDTYLREGAAVGVMFEMRAGLLKNELQKQRQAAVDELKSQQATMEEFQLAGVTVSKASTPNNRLRSFQVTLGDYSLVTNSSTIAARFIAVAKGDASLADTASFRLARSRFPVDEETAVFSYLSPEFFRGLVSPHYQTELRRRLRSVTDIELVQLAQLAARHEGYPANSVQDLTAAAVLPPDFGYRADGSQLVFDGERWTDSLRGARGTFLPIPDVATDAVTAYEAETFSRVTQFHRQSWQTMDPLVLEVRRSSTEEDAVERIDIRGEMLPFDRDKYGQIISMIGPPMKTQVRQSPQDAITVQAIVQGGRMRPGIGVHHLFVGVQDHEIPIEFARQPALRLLQVLRSAPAYLGAWPKMGLLDMLPLRFAPTFDGGGMARLPFGLWQKETFDGFSLIGTNPEVLNEASQHLAIEETESEAQIRVHVADMSQSKLRTWFAALDFQRAYQTSMGNTKLAHALNQQLGVPQSKTMETAEKILGVDLVCALGGEYQLYEDHGRTFWGSTHWPLLSDDSTPEGPFASPLMAWFRGLDADVTLLPDRVTANATVLVKKPPEGKKLELPFFNFFGK